MHSLLLKNFHPMKLQAGTVEALYYSQTLNPLYNAPILQITALSKFSLGPNDRPRYKGNLSDGTYYMKALFSSELTELFDEGEIRRFSSIKLDKFSVRPKEGTSYLYILGISLCEQADSEIGNPVNVSNGKLSLEPSTSAKSDSKFPAAREPQNMKNTANSYVNLTKPSKNSLAAETNTDDKIIEIKRIFPQKKPFKFKGRVISKSDLKTFTSVKGEGKVFSFVVADMTGQIKCVAFSEVATMFYPFVENNKVYTISNVTVRPSNKKFTNATSDFEIHLEKCTEIKRTDNEDGIPMYAFKFVKFSDLATVGGVVDCLGVIKEVYQVSKIVSKTTGRENTKRDLVLMDQTGTCRLTIWGPRAEEEYEKDTVVALGAVKVDEYNGVNLSVVQNSQLISNIDIPEAVALLAWYENNGKDIVIEKPKRILKLSLIDEVRSNSLEYATIQGTIMYMKEDGLFYAACPSENCNKKVSQEDNGMFRCEKCNYTFEKCNYRYMISLQIGDFTGQMWITAFDEAGKCLMGITAEELKEMGDVNPEELHIRIKNVCSKDFQFKLKNREENYNGEMKLRSTCMEVTPVDRILDTKRMLEMIERATI